VARLGEISSFRLLFKAPGTFLPENISQKSGDILGHLCLKHFFYSFNLISSFKACFACRRLRVSKVVDGDVSDFQIEL
jgi:hypothetical protein